MATTVLEEANNILLTARINWSDYPWVQNRILELDAEGKHSNEIAHMLPAEYPQIFPTRPTADSVRLAITRAKEKVDRIKGLPEQEILPEPDVQVGTFIGLRTLYVDIEATNLGAAFGHVLCTSFADEYGNVETYRLDDPRFAGRNIIDDGPLCAAVRDRMESVDVVVGHNFRLYDKAFLNARLIKAGERPINDSLKIVDSLYLVGGQNMRLGSRRLETVAKFLNLPVQKTPLDGETWQLAGAGDKAALDSVVEHCEHDVLVERLAFARLKGFISVIHR